MIAIQEAILVEGRYDKNKLSQIVDTAIFEANGFGIMGDREKIAFLRKVAEARGLIIFTDSDGAGFVIRNRLKGQLPADRLLHAYIPQLPGKEKRKRKGGKEGLLGVEGVSNDVILDALRKSGAHFLDGDMSTFRGSISKQDLYLLGLSGTPDSSKRREIVKKEFALPSHLGTNAFLDALNLITTKEALSQLLERTFKSS